MQDVKKATDHLKNHQDYPATKEELVAACNNLSDFSEEDKRTFEENLPEGVYESAEDVIRALGWEAPKMTM